MAMAQLPPMDALSPQLGVQLTLLLLKKVLLGLLIGFLAGIVF